MMNIGKINFNYLRDKFVEATDSLSYSVNFKKFLKGDDSQLNNLFDTIEELLAVRDKFFKTEELDEINNQETETTEKRNKMKEINNFRDPQYAWLMNSYPVDIMFEGEVYPTVEHAFQAAKTDDVYDRERIQKAPSARKAKQIGRSMTIRSSWDDERVDVMRDLLEVKFENSDLRKKLLATKDSKLVAGGDNFWGVRNGDGKNHLGQLLMKVRQDMLIEHDLELKESLRDYLVNCGWSRDSSGDGMWGECWTPPWDDDCQYQLVDAVMEQHKVSKVVCDVGGPVVTDDIYKSLGI